MKRATQWWLISSMFSALSLAAILFVGTDIVLRRIRHGRQVRTHAICQTYVAYLSSFRERSGHYPAMLADAVPSDRPGLKTTKDAWNNVLYYESNGEGFVLASLGSDGQPDTARFAHVDTASK